MARVEQIVGKALWRSHGARTKISASDSSDLVSEPGMGRVVSGSAEWFQDQCCSLTALKPLFNTADY
jgi:hypothetical protein